MKRIFRYILAAVAFSAAFACQEKEPEGGDEGGAKVEPVFPTDVIVNNTVNPGDELEVTFTPNMDWELSVPSDVMQYFKLMDANGRYKEVVSGSASDQPVVVRVWVSPIEEYDNNRSCEVTLTMGGKSKVIAEFMRPAKLRTLKLYTAKVQADTLALDETGAYIYEECQETINIIWSPSHKEFVMPVKVESNCQWDIDRTSFPEWLTLQVPQMTEGVVYLDLKGSSLNDASGVMVMKAGDAELKRFNVTVPSCREIDVYSAKFEEGDWVYTDGGYEYAQAQDNMTMIWTGTDYRLPVKVDSKCEWTLTYPDWLDVTLDSKRGGEYQFNLMGKPDKYPLDDVTAKIAFSFKGEVIKEMNLTIPGCRDKISLTLAMSLTSLEFNYSGQYKTTAGYQEAPVTGSAMVPSTVSLLSVEIVDGKYVTSQPQWLSCRLFVDEDTNTSHVLQNKAFEVTVTENMAASARSAYIFLLPAQVTDLSELFEEDGCTVKEAYLPYSIPVIQACVPADYLTPELTAEEMTEQGAAIVKSEDAELLDSPVFGQTRYAYELTYKNTWSSDGARMYLTYPYAMVELYDDQKQKVADAENYWVRFTDYAEDKTYGAFTIPTQLDENDEVKAVPAGSAYAVFKDAEGATLCVVRFIYAPEIPEEPEIPEGSENEADASHYFADPQAAAEAGATLKQILKVEVPSPAPKKPSALPDGATETEKAEYEAAMEAYNEYQYLRALYQQFSSCNSYDAPMLKLTYTAKETSLVLAAESLLKGVANLYSVNPYVLSGYVMIDGSTNDETAGRLVPYGSSAKYDGTPEIKMNLYDADPDAVATQPVVVLFYNADNRIILGLVCVQELN